MLRGEVESKVSDTRPSDKRWSVGNTGAWARETGAHKKSRRDA
jgi:hypothetical protein